MWYMLENVQQSYDLSDRLIRAISRWQIRDEDDVVDDLLERGADVNKLHGTLLPLHCACMTGDVHVVELLLRHNAQVNAVDGYSRTALHYAAECDDTACVQVLLSAGADMDARDGNGDTPLHWASFRGSSHCVDVLLRQGGADLDALDSNRSTSLAWASKRASVVCVDLLLQYNASPEAADLDGRTPINHAVMSPPGANRDAVIILLLRAAGRLDVSSAEFLRRLQLPAASQRLNAEIEAGVGCRPLCHLCRRAIRQQLGPRRLADVVSGLPLPKSLREFLLLQK